MTLAWHDGAVIPTADVRVGADDRGVTVGLGVFETVRVIDRAPFALERHLRRLASGLLRTGIAGPPSPEIHDAVTALIAASPFDDARVRITVTAAQDHAPARWWVTIDERVEPPAVAAVTIAPWWRNEHAVLAGVKTTSYAENVVARQWGRDRGADEVLFANTAGDLCEGTASNVFVVSGGRIATPSLDSGCLAGVIRELVVELCDAVEERVPLEALARADEVFLTSSLRHVQPVERIDDRRLSPPFDVAARVSRALEAVARAPRR